MPCAKPSSAYCRRRGPSPCIVASVPKASRGAARTLTCQPRARELEAGLSRKRRRAAATRAVTDQSRESTLPDEDARRALKGTRWRSQRVLERRERRRRVVWRDLAGGGNAGHNSDAGAAPSPLVRARGAGGNCSMRSRNAQLSAGEGARGDSGATLAGEGSREIDLVGRAGAWPEAVDSRPFHEDQWSLPRRDRASSSRGSCAVPQRHREHAARCRGGVPPPRRVRMSGIECVVAAFVQRPPSFDEARSRQCSRPRRWCRPRQ